MRIQHYLIIFTLLFFIFVTPQFINTQILARSGQINTNYSNMLLTATEGAMESVRENSNQTLYFNTEKSREQAVNVFYETLIKDFNYENSTYKDLVKYYVPCIFLIDNNGYYIEYTAEYTDSNGYSCFKENITPINKWSKTYSFGGNGLSGEIYQVEFHLDDTLKIMFQNPDSETFIYEGTYEELHSKISEDNTGLPPNIIDMLSSYTNFYNEKRDVIINSLNEKMVYYINVHDESLNQFNNAQYQFTLPQITGEDWARMIDQPTVIAFLQGVQTEYKGNYMNIYSLAGSEVEYAKTYIVEKDGSGILYYHEPGCPLCTGGDADTAAKGYSMEEASKKGAYPCYECIH